ncbi:DUF4180 domain-containing protein [Klenkia terrae]|uniref:DUF4180 domain-containing protein n=1 Tax=Klenkia terrae TaxID=1052259 RepID=UPI001CD8DCCB|nr:DUF4180 domain-containing protein [Klenkia terrae]
MTGEAAAPHPDPVVEVRGGVACLRLPADGPPLDGEQAAVDVVGEAYGPDARVVVVPVERLPGDFFVLRSGVAGAVTQKFVQYGVRLVVLGDPAALGPTSGPVADWVREADRGRDLAFVADEAELDRRLGPASAG